MLGHSSGCGSVQALNAIKEGNYSASLHSVFSISFVNDIKLRTCISITIIFITYPKHCQCQMLKYGSGVLVFLMLIQVLNLN